MSLNFFVQVGPVGVIGPPVVLPESNRLEAATENDNPREPYKSHIATYKTPGGDMVVTTEWWGSGEPESEGGVPDVDIWGEEEDGITITQRVAFCDSTFRPASVIGPFPDL